MNDNYKIDTDLTELSVNNTNAFNQYDQQTLFYFIQMTELMYNEIGYEIYDKDKLYDFVCNTYKNNTNIVFQNLKDYYLRIINGSIDEFCKIVKASAFNKYINSNNLNNIYVNFKSEIIAKTKLDDKIKALSLSNGNLLLEQIYTNCVVNNKKNINEIVKKYVDLITEELIKNIVVKNELILNSYKSFIDGLTKETLEDMAKIRQMNLKVITNATYLYLKEQEYVVIDKYINKNIKLINSLFRNFEEKVKKELDIKKHSDIKLNTAKDYLLGFNNTIRVKARNIFDEMNFAVTLEENQMRSKVKEFNELITHIYELNLKFDKLFQNYRKEFYVTSHNRDKFIELFNKEFQEFKGEFKLNISNIFRDNTKIYNDIVYKSLLLKSRVDEFSEILSESKVKDLLLK